MANAGNEWLTTSDVADRLDVGLSTVTLWCRSGVLPNAQKLGEGSKAPWMIPASDLEDFTPPKPGYPKGRPRI